MARPANPNLQQMLVDAATAVFAEKGLAEAKVSDITDLAGVAKGSFYLHFESKEALFELICRAFIDDVVRHMEGYAALMCAGPELPANFMDRLANADEALLGLLWERRPYLRMVLQGAVGTHAATLQDDFVDAIERTMRATIVQAHEMMPFEPPMSADFLAAMAAGLLLMYARRVVRSDELPQISQDVHRFRRILMIGAVLSGEQLDAMLADLTACAPLTAARPLAELDLQASGADR